MSSETNRLLHRVSANYVRLFTTLAIGIVLVPLQIHWLGIKAFGALTFVSASVGIAAMLEDLTRQSLIRELAGAYHTGRDQFLRAYHSAYLISTSCAVLTALAFGVLALGVAIIPDEDRHFIAAARWLILFEAAFTVLRVLSAPTINLFVVFERFVLHNAVIVALRLSRLVATVVLYLGFEIQDPALGLILFGAVSAAINTVVICAAVAILWVQDRALRPSLRRAEPGVARSQLSTFGWNSGVIVALGLHERVPQLIVLGLFGLEATAAYGLAFRLAGYVRMFATGVTGGLDSVAARVSSYAELSPLLRLVRQSTRLHAMAVFPCACGVFLLATPLMTLWVGRSVENPDVVPTAILLTQIIMVATSSRAISDAWLHILYGAGYVRRYAPTVLVGGVLNPIAACVLLAVLPPERGLLAPAIAFAAIFSFFHMVLLPIIGARTLSIPLRDMFRPLLRPAAVVILPMALLALATTLVSHWTLTTFLLVGGAYATMTALASFAFALSSGERQRLLAIARLTRFVRRQPS